MSDLLALRTFITNQLSGSIGTYTLPDKSVIPAIAVLPDSVLGNDFPPAATVPNGLEVVLLDTRLENAPTLAGQVKHQTTILILRQWDSAKTTLQAIDSLLPYLNIIPNGIDRRVAQDPNSNEITTIQLASYDLCEV